MVGAALALTGCTRELPKTALTHADGRRVMGKLLNEFIFAHPHEWNTARVIGIAEWRRENTIAYYTKRWGDPDDYDEMQMALAELVEEKGKEVRLGEKGDIVFCGDIAIRIPVKAHDWTEGASYNIGLQAWKVFDWEARPFFHVRYPKSREWMLKWDANWEPNWYYSSPVW